MTMTFSLHESIEPNSAFDHIENFSSVKAASLGRAESGNYSSGRSAVPSPDGLIERPRLMNLLGRSKSQYPATLISGRAGTGKTSIAAAYARECSKVSWYSISSTDTEWSKFARGFSESLLGSDWNDVYRVPNSRREEPVTQKEIARFLIRNFTPTSVFPAGVPALIVLDDIHHIFDAAWFDEFFNLLIYSLPSDAHLLMLCRSRPPGPLMRLRSKQLLNLLDEKVITFDQSETDELFKTMGLAHEYARLANQECFGRVAKLIAFADDVSANLPSS